MAKRATEVKQPELSRGFHRLAIASTVLTFILIVLGTVVRVSNSGLGCGPGGSGLRGWPLCEGRLIPLIDTHMLVEYSHRTTAAAVVVLIAVMAVLAWHRFRWHSRITKALVAAIGIVLAQAVLGGLTVETGLNAPLVAAHLATAMALLALMIYVTLVTRPRRYGDTLQPATKRMQALVAAAGIAVFLTIVVGGYVSATQGHGTSEHHEGHSVQSVCGDVFPTCNGSLLPIGHGLDANAHLLHRAIAGLAALLIIAVFVAALSAHRNRYLLRISGLALGLIAVQVLLGAMNIWIGERVWLVALHAAAAALLWTSQVTLMLLSLGQPALESAPPRTPREAEAVPA